MRKTELASLPYYIDQYLFAPVLLFVMWAPFFFFSCFMMKRCYISNFVNIGLTVEPEDEVLASNPPVYLYLLYNYDIELRLI